jgi:hypothetical protein
VFNLEMEEQPPPTSFSYWSWQKEEIWEIEEFNVIV